MRTSTTSLALSLALLAFAQSPPPILWQKCLGNAEGDGGTLVCPANDGGWFVAVEGQFLLSQTSMSDFWLVKLNAAGSVEWDQPLGGSGPDFPYALVGTSDGGCVVVGETWSSNGDVSGYHGGHDGWVVKVDGQGNLEWQRCIGGKWGDMALGVLAADDGGYVITGISSSSDGDMIGQHGWQDAWVAKLDGTGSMEWLRLLGGSAFELPRSIVPMVDGGWLLGIRSESYDGDVSGLHGSMDAWLVKLDDQGNITWQQAYGGSARDRLANALPTSDGGCVFAAMTASDDGDVIGQHGLDDYWLVKVDPTGTIEWHRTMGGSYLEGATELVAASDGGYFINGYTESIDGDVLDQHSSVTGVRDIWVVKVSGAGDVLWTRALGGSEADEPFFDMEENDIPHTLVATADGGCVVVGRTGSLDGDVTGLHGSGDLDAWAVMLAGSGALLWQRALGGGLPDFATQVHLSSNDELFVSGITYSNDGDVSGNNGASDAWVVKLGSIASGMDETTVAGFVMTPSPASDQVELRLDGSSMGTIQFTDLAGRMALNVRMTSGVTTIDVATLARGCYIVTVQSLSGVRRSQRLILE